jgi:hypothetical protein
VTVAVVVSVAGCGPVSAVAARAPAAGFVSAFALAPVAAVVAEPVVAVGSGPVLIFAARAPAAAGPVSAFVLAAEPAVAVLLIWLRFSLNTFLLLFLPPLLFLLLLMLIAFLLFLIFPAVRAAHRPLC